MAPARQTSTTLSRRALAAASAVLAAVAAAVGMWLATDAPGTPARVPIKVRWAAGAADREQMEVRFHLTAADFDEGTTWRYVLTDISTGNIRALVTHPAVEDTANLDRIAYRVAGALDPGRARILRSVRAGGMAALVVLLGWWAGGLIGAGRRRQHGTADAGSAGQKAAVEALLAGAARSPGIELATALLVLPLVTATGSALWWAPFPISETVGILADVQTAAHSFFDPTVRSWYRPLYFSTWQLFWQGTGSLPAALTLFRWLEVSSVVVLIAVLLRCMRPRSWLDAGAACVAVAILTGAPAFRDNLEVPLLYTLVAMPLAAVLWNIAEAPARRWHAPAIIAIVAVAVGFKEQGLVLVAVVVMAWMAGSPGVTKWTAVATVAFALVYLGVRFSTSGTWQPFEQAVGLGFQTLSASDANARFGGAPLPIYAYNAAATLGNMLVSEPTNGEFRFIGNLLRGEAAPWQFNHVASSAALTVLLAWWSWGTLRHRRRTSPVEARLVLILGAALAASSALGFNYARDRLGGMALVFLALAGYHAIRRAAAIAAAGSGAPAVVLAGVLGLLAVAWQVRAVGTVEYVRYATERAQREWITAPYLKRVNGTQSLTYADLFERLRAQGTASSAPVRHAYPDWLQDVLGER
jgi:hypothetical protein